MQRQFRSPRSERQFAERSEQTLAFWGGKGDRCFILASCEQKQGGHKDGSQTTELHGSKKLNDGGHTAPLGALTAMAPEMIGMAACTFRADGDVVGGEAGHLKPTYVDSLEIY